MGLPGCTALHRGGAGSEKTGNPRFLPLLSAARQFVSRRKTNESSDEMKEKDKAAAGAIDSMAPEAEGMADAKAPKRKRRGLRILLGILLALLLLVLVVGAVVFFYARYTKTHYEITFYQETSTKVSQNIRLVVIADIHNREYGEGNATLISDIRSLDPDLILFAGDMVLYHDDDYTAALHLVEELSALAPCYGVMGNHENERIYLAGDTQLPERFERAGLKLLRNAEEKIAIGPDTLQLIGVEGTSAGFEKYGGRKAMDETEIDPKSYCIVMAHIPILFDGQLSDYDFDLGIAGHVHGGIVNIPHFGGLISMEEGFFPTYCAGKYTLSRQQSLLISRGLADSRPIPRVNNMPELMVVDINWC